MKILSTNQRRMKEGKPITGCKVSERWRKIWEEKEKKKKAEWIDLMKTEFKRLEEGSKADIYLSSLRVTLKKIPNYEIPGQNKGMLGFWFIKMTSIHDSLPRELSKCLEKANIHE